MDLLTGNVKKIFLKYLVAAMGSAIVLSVYGMVDAIAVGQYAGGTGTAVMAVVTPVWGIITFFGVMCSIGGSILMGKARGEGKLEKSNNYFTISFLLEMLISCSLWVYMLCNMEQVLRVFGADDALLPHVMEYAQWIQLAFPIYIFSAFLAVFVRNDDAPYLAVAAVAIGGTFNIFGDWFFVFVVDMGISGAGFATFMGEVLQNIVLCSRFFSKKTKLRFVRPHNVLRNFGAVLVNGFSAGIIDLANAALIILFNAQIMRYADENTLAVYGAICACTYLFVALFSGVGQAAQPLISNCLGAGLYDRIRETVRLSVAAALVLGCIIGLSGVLFPRQFVRVFIDVTPEILEIAPGIVRPFFLSFLLAGFNIFGAYYFQCIMRAGVSLGITLLRGIAVSGAMAILMPLLFGGIQGLWWAMPVTEVVISVLVLVCMHKQVQEMVQEDLLK